MFGKAKKRRAGTYSVKEKGERKEKGETEKRKRGKEKEKEKEKRERERKWNYASVRRSDPIAALSSETKRRLIRVE